MTPPQGWRPGENTRVPSRVPSPALEAAAGPPVRGVWGCPGRVLPTGPCRGSRVRRCRERGDSTVPQDEARGCSSSCVRGRGGTLGKSKIRAGLQEPRGACGKGNGQAKGDGPGGQARGTGQRDGPEGRARGTGQGGQARGTGLPCCPAAAGPSPGRAEGPRRPAWARAPAAGSAFRVPQFRQGFDSQIPGDGGAARRLLPGNRGTARHPSCVRRPALGHRAGWERGRGGRRGGGSRGVLGCSLLFFLPILLPTPPPPPPPAAALPRSLLCFAASALPLPLPLPLHLLRAGGWRCEGLEPPPPLRFFSPSIAGCARPWAGGPQSCFRTPRGGMPRRDAVPQVLSPCCRCPPLSGSSFPPRRLPPSPGGCGVVLGWAQSWRGGRTGHAPRGRAGTSESGQLPVALPAGQRLMSPRLGLVGRGVEAVWVPR